jgi:hypothetical protein
MIKTVSQYQYEYWEFLKDRGWKMIPSPISLGTANTDLNKKTINVRPSVFAQPSIRVVRYVIPHEIWHALHGELLDYMCMTLRTQRRLTAKSAIEVVADSGCLFMDDSRAMNTWVRSSVMWHGRVGYRYSMSDVRSKEALDLVNMLDAEARRG